MREQHLYLSFAFGGPDSNALVQRPDFDSVAVNRGSFMLGSEKSRCTRLLKSITVVSPSTSSWKSGQSQRITCKVSMDMSRSFTSFSLGWVRRMMAGLCGLSFRGLLEWLSTTSMVILLYQMISDRSSMYGLVVTSGRTGFGRTSLQLCLLVRVVRLMPCDRPQLTVNISAPAWG